MKENRALQGQLKLHWEKVELIREFNSSLAERITDFTNRLIDCNFKGVFSVYDDVYHNGLGISQSRFSYLEKSPATYYHRTYIAVKTNLKRPKHFVEGDFIHRIVLEKDTIENMFVSEAAALRLAWTAKPDSKNIRATKEYKQKVAEYKLDGKEVIREDLFDEIHLFEKFIQEEPVIRNILDNGVSEKAIYCICPETGLIRKGKTDFILPAENDMISLLDLKSTRDIAQDSVEKSIDNYRYHTQAAYYIDLAQDAIGKKVKDYLLLVVEKEAPFECDLGFIVDEVIDGAGRHGHNSGYKKFMRTLAKCYESGEFNRNKLVIKPYGIPQYAMNGEVLNI